MNAASTEDFALDSARVSLAGECVLAFVKFLWQVRGQGKSVVARRDDQHARRARYPDAGCPVDLRVEANS